LAEFLEYAAAQAGDGDDGGQLAKQNGQGLFQGFQHEAKGSNRYVHPHLQRSISSDDTFNFLYTPRAMEPCL
jgi:hypothetical protein